MSSYHPSPFGVFNQVKLIPRDNTADPIVCTAANEGLIFFDAVESKLMTCRGSSGSSLVATWEQSGKLIYPTDTTQDVFVGIGDFTPDALLEISASGLSHPYLLLSSDDNTDGDAFIVTNNGNVGLSTLVPRYRLTLDRDKADLGTADASIIAYGQLGAGATHTSMEPIISHPYFFWYPRTASLYATRTVSDATAPFNQYNYSFGYDTYAGGYGAFSSGYHTDADFSNAFSAGQNTIAGNNYAFATGNATTASGEYSVATGDTTTASGVASVAMGHATIASGSAATAFGDTTTASGDYALAMGKDTTASGTASIASGRDSVANGEYAVAMGNDVQAAGEAAVAFGTNCTASGVNAFASGSNAAASGTGSVAIGLNVQAPAYAQTVLGLNNVVNGTETADAWDVSDPLFVIGNGDSVLTPSNALTVLKNGNVAINAADPGTYRLKVVGGDASVDAANDWYALSDARLKKNIMAMKNPLTKLLALQAVRYHALAEPPSGPAHIGFIAQDVEPYFPSLVVTDKTSPRAYKSLSYSRMTPVLLEAVKALKQENAALEDQVSKIKEKMAVLKKLKQELDP
jgi:hypothetical protein